MRDPLFRVTIVSKNEICPFCSCSTVKFMCVSMEFSKLWKLVIACFLMIENTSSTKRNHFLGGVSVS